MEQSKIIDMLETYQNIIWIFSEFLYAWFDIFASLSDLFIWFGQLDCFFLQRERCFVMGLIIRCSILVTERDMTCTCIIAIKDKKMGFIHINWVDFVYNMSSCLRRYSVLYELNTLDTCWITVDVWSNSSRCRQESV